MYACPSCGKESITGWEKTNSNKNFPKKCRKCGERYYISSWGLFPFILSFDFLLWGSIILALSVRSWFGLLLFPIGILSGYVLLAKYGALKRISDVEVKEYRIKTVIVVVTLFVVLFGYDFFFQND